MNRLKAISMHQPYPSFVAIGLKRFETRNRPTSHRGDLAICSSLKTPPFLMANVALLWKTWFGVDPLPAGRVICVVEVWECWTTEHLKNLRHGIGETELILGDYRPGRYGWALRNVRRLKEPVKVRGYQGFFYLPPDVEAKVRAQIS